MCEERWKLRTLLNARDDDDEDVEISTVFLCLNHNHGVGQPILYETMVFGGKKDGYMRRYITRQEAKKGHEETVAMVKGFQPKGKENG